MNNLEILLKQYEIYSLRKQHFGSLFWQIPALFLGVCVLITSVYKDLTGNTRWIFLMLIGLLLILVSYIAKRLKDNEDCYEVMLIEIEYFLKTKVGEGFQIAPKSKAYGARFYAVCAYAGIGIVLVLVSAVCLVRG
jgi:hypothetical protein